MIERKKIIKWLDKYLNADAIDEYCPNGLQIEGKKEIQKIVVGVSASLEFLEAALDHNADMVIVHHGIIWKGDWNRIIGSYAKKIKLCLDNGLNLVAYHLPLDGHLEVGNALGLAKLLKLKNIQSYGDYSGIPLGVSGEFKLSNANFIKLVHDKINKDSLILDYSDQIKRVAIITGGAQAEFRSAINDGFDAYITGEVSEWVYHMAKEEKKTFVGAGHHATEKYGVQLLAKKIKGTFSLKTEFIDCHNPI